MPDPGHATEPIAWLNGTFLPFRDAVLPVYDLGIVQGATLTERLRTVRHRPWLVEPHLDRLARGLSVVGWDGVPDRGELARILDQIASHNAKLLSPEGDLALILFVTAGQAVGDANGLIEQSRPTVCVHSSPLPVETWRTGYTNGVDLVTPALRHIPPECLDPSLKMRSRLNWHLAGQQAAAGFSALRSGALVAGSGTSPNTKRSTSEDRGPHLAALLLDLRGFVTETSTGNLFIVREGRLLTPREETTLPGISQQHVIALAERNGLSVERADLTPEEVAAADEAFLTSSTYCIMPVRTVNGQSIGGEAMAIPGPVTERLCELWSAEMGLDFRNQRAS
jgi:branched-chain amino acid aminotransferase